MFSGKSECPAGIDSRSKDGLLGRLSPDLLERHHKNYPPHKGVILRYIPNDAGSPWSNHTRSWELRVIAFAFTDYHGDGPLATLRLRRKCWIKQTADKLEKVYKRRYKRGDITEQEGTNTGWCERCNNMCELKHTLDAPHP